MIAPVIREIAMDPTAFVTWLEEMASLTAPQRRRAWQALALSEIPDSRDSETRSTIEQGSARFARAVDEPQPAVLAPLTEPANRVGAVSVAELGRRRVDSVGCPHCDNRDVVRWGQASDLPRYRCKACSRTFNALTKTPLANLFCHQ